RGTQARPAAPRDPPGVSSPQLSMSAARASPTMIAAARTNQGADPPSVAAATPEIRKAATPGSANASAAAFQTETNGSSAVDDRTTRMGRRGRVGGDGGIGNQRNSAS